MQFDIPTRWGILLEAVPNLEVQLAESICYTTGRQGLSSSRYNMRQKIFEWDLSSDPLKMLGWLV